LERDGSQILPVRQSAAKNRSYHLKDNYFPAESVRQEIETFCTRLGLSEQYFQTVPLETIARHIEALRAGEILAMVRGEKAVRIDLASESAEEALYLVEDNHYRAIEIEERIEKNYPGFRIQSYRSAEKLHGAEYLRWYLVSRPDFASREIKPQETDLKKVADQGFLSSISRETFDHYQALIKKPERKKVLILKLPTLARKKPCGLPLSATAIPSPGFLSMFLT